MVRDASAIKSLREFTGALLLIEKMGITNTVELFSDLNIESSWDVMQSPPIC